MLSVRRLLDNKKINSVWSVRPDHMVIDALALMSQQGIGAVLVMDEDQLIGIFSERDYARKGIIVGRKAKSTPVTEVMTANVFTVSPDMDIEDCMTLFSEKRIRHLPVMENQKVIGMLSIGDIVSAIIQAQDQQIRYLEAYITGQ
ncbi:CBS domain-containing protein [Haliscomenobacter hydrossis]|uniref:Signal transduction protein with CBS domains n=1 Tax=Haliscomenobacter hydrossis (strain ATCC 27775 / DSM 1100 / LMG 10767 / O) TaxID=760192 RepID=F4KTV2_HALH1|nr:CBS domain-containing protein [Haliscomenobacter hydrossis]AEE48096.1 putative signal transduction protein with CBS domains [Haliscomenobacter hydrossis DSM 1100]